jgi:hypothetical protein
MDLNPLISIWTKETKISRIYIENICEDFKNELIKQGLEETNIKFYPYLIIKIKKKLGLETTSITLKRFKKFLNEKEN